MGKSQSKEHKKEIQELRNKTMELKKMIEELTKTKEEEERQPNPWREEVEFDKNEAVRLLKSVWDVNPTDIKGEVDYFNLLFIGETQGGKSSTINSFLGILCGDLMTIRRAEKSRDSVTKKYRIYTPKSKSGQEVKIKFCESMGYPEPGMQIEELEQIMDGKIPNGYEFQAGADSNTESRPLQPLKENPGINDRMHCLIIVVDANNYLEKQKIRSLKKYKRVADNKDICTCIIVTKIDEISKMVKEDTATVYRSREVERVVKEVAEVSGLDKNAIFPVRNIVDQTKIDLALKEQILALTALNYIISCCQTTLHRQPFAVQH